MENLRTKLTTQLNEGLFKLSMTLLMGLLSVTFAMGQTDVTYLMTNPDFEDGVVGWKTDGIGPQTNNDFRYKHGNTYVEYWTGWGGTVPDRMITQKLTNLPIGVYTLTAAGQNIQQETPNKVQTGAYFFAGNSAVEFGLPGDYCVTATSGDGTLVMGARTRNATGNWVCIDHFRLTYTVVADSLQPYLQALIDEATDVISEGTSADSVATRELEAAKSLAQSYLGTQLTEGLVETMQRLKAAIQAYRLSRASETNPFDMTYAIVNPSFEENGTKGWTVVGMNTQTNNSFSQKAGSTYLECWTWRGNAVGDGSVRQRVTQLPSGNYRLTAVAQNIQEDSPAANKTGAWIFANDKKKAVYKAAQYRVDFTCITGEVEIGFEAKKAQGNWIAVDNFQLLYLGVSEETNLAQLATRIEEAEGLVEKHMNADTLSVLIQAVEAAKAYTAEQDLTAVASVLEQAVTAAKTSIAAYEQLAVAITKAQKVLAGTENANEGTEFERAIAEAQAVYDDLYTTNLVLTTATATLQRAVFVFHLANPSGTIPTVTTYPEVICGCKAAVGRLKVNVGNLLERGFCWSTHPEPTVLDNRSTTYYDFNGQVFLMPDLQPSTTYYVRAYAMSRKYAVGYGDVVRIITLPEAHVTYSYNMAAPDEGTNERIDNACKTAVEYLNTWTSISGFHPSVNYDAGEDGAHGSYGGWITLGPGFTQNPGTVMHEMGHGIGVGQHWRYTSWDSPLHPTMYWTGERANRVFAFFENQKDVYNDDGTFASGGNHTVADGDRVHVCYGLSGVTAPIDLLRQAAFYQGMYEDGMPAVGDGACPFYSFDCVEGEKYYITNEKYGLGTKFLTVLSTGKLNYKAVEADELLNDDAYAWHVDYDPLTGLYHIRNAQSGKYLTFRSGFTTRDVTTFTSEDRLQLMPARTSATMTMGDTLLTVKPYWVVCGNRVESPEAMTVSSLYTSAVSSPQLDFYDTATHQHWVILSSAQIDAVTSDIRNITPSVAQGDGAIYDLQGRQIVNGKSVNGKLPRGIYIMNGKKILIK